MRRTSTGLITLFAVGVYYAWQNRFRIQRFLESQGFNLPLSTRNVGDTVRSGIAKVTGSTEHQLKKAG